MPNIDLIKGLNFSDGNNKLVTVFGNDAAIYNGTNWIGQHINLVPSTFEMAMGKNYAFLLSPGNAPKSMTSTGTWSTTVNLLNAPSIAKYPFLFGDRMFFGNCTINGTTYPRRFFYTDIIESDSSIYWAMEYGSDLVQTAGSKSVTSATAKFISSRVKIGDPFFVVDGSNVGVYATEEIVSETEIILDRSMIYAGTGTKYLVGGNWFDIDGEVTGVGEYYNTMLAFQYNKVWRWSSSVGKKEVYGVNGTSSHRSIVNNHRGYTFWYNPNDGIVQFNGNVAKSCSDKISPIIDAITDPTAVVGWEGVGKYKDHVYFYIGNVTFTVNGESYSLNKVIIDYNIIRNKWKIQEYNAVIKCATTFITNNVKEVYLGTDSSLVLKFNSGNSDYDVVTNNGTATLPIHSYMISHPIYPSGIEVMNKFDKLYGWKDKGTGVKLKYKRHGIIDKNDSDWSDAIEINDNYREAKLDPQRAEARGVSIMISEISKDPSFEFLGYSLIYTVVGEAFRDEL